MSDVKSPMEIYVTHELPKDTTPYSPPLQAFVTYKPAIKVVQNADTFRRNAGKVTLNLDTERKVVSVNGTDVGNFDLARLLTVKETGNSDTLKSVVYKMSDNADTLMKVISKQVGNSETVRRIPYSSKNLNPSQISISLQRGTLSDTFQMTIPYDLDLESLVKGQIYDYPYHFLVYESGGTGMMRTITGMYDVDKLLYTPFTYHMRISNATARDHAEQIAKLLGKQLVCSIDNFTPESNYTGRGATIQNLIGSLFGWMENLPQRWINVFIREDTLYIIQRGHELRAVDITGAAHSRPEIDRKLMRSVWSGTSNTGHDAHGSLTIEPLGYTGTISFGDSFCQYRAGLLVFENNNGETVSYSYDSDDYLIQKVTKTKDGQTITATYSYARSMAEEKFLACETEVTEKQDESSAEWSTRVTQHSYIGNGWYGTRVYVDGVYQGSSIGNGKPGGKTNRYVIDQSNLGLGGKYANSGSSSGAALFDTEFPVKGKETLKQLTRDIEWLNRKTEERISMDLWQFPHVLDFTDRIIYKGNAYYLESNQVVRTPTELKQSIEIVRWY